jgi:hypothetical protein
VADVLTDGLQGSLFRNLDACCVGEEGVEVDNAEHIPFASVIASDADDVAGRVPPHRNAPMAAKGKDSSDGLHGFATLPEGFIHPAIQEERPDQEAQVQEDRNSKDQEFRG